MRKHETKIERFYRIANRRYWGGRLPCDVIVRWDAGLLRRDRCVGMLQHYPGVCIVIRISSILRKSPGLAGLVIMHEMAHLAVQLRLGKAYGGHGLVFQREMLRLARAGALSTLW